MKHTLPELPYQKNELEPHISAETLEFHHGKHHKKYVDTLNELIKGTEFENMSLDEIVKRSTGKVFNNAGQTWNHNFYWKCLAPKSRAPQGELMDALKNDFGSFEEFREKFNAAAAGQFGSGWAWLVLTPEGRLEIEATSNAGNPIREGKTPLWTCDVWEHAYYIDYRNDRGKYLQSIWEVTNWAFIESNFSSARQKAA